MRLVYDGRSLEMQSGETVLECMERHGFSVPSSCRSGVCQSCLLRATKGPVPAVAQSGLKSSRKEEGYFMACLCRPIADLEIGLDSASFTFESSVVQAGLLGPSVYGVCLSIPEGFTFRAGQFVQVIRPADGLTRPYSLAAPERSGVLELHIATVAQGRMSGWLPFAVGQRVFIRGPFGECVYRDRDSEHALLLAGTGTGLAPLLGIVRSALATRHEGPIRLYHGARMTEGLYAREALNELAREHANIEIFYPVLECRDEDLRNGIRRQRINEAVLSDFSGFDDARAYLCGDPELVRVLRRQLYMRGMSLDRIHSDAFVTAPPPNFH